MSNSTFEPGKYTRFKDNQGRVFIVVGQERDWDEKRQESRGWLTITLYNLATCKTESPMPFDRFVHYVAKGKLTRFSPMSYQPRKF